MENCVYFKKFGEKRRNCSQAEWNFHWYWHISRPWVPGSHFRFFAFFRPWTILSVYVFYFNEKGVCSTVELTKAELAEKDPKTLSTSFLIMRSHATVQKTAQAEQKRLLWLRSFVVSRIQSRNESQSAAVKLVFPLKSNRGVWCMLYDICRQKERKGMKSKALQSA